jgi:hypothetical protein
MEAGIDSLIMCANIEPLVKEGEDVVGFKAKI